jgi:LuxR family maltose regulon positive regulatory protein
MLLLAQNEIKQARDYLRACYQRASQGGWVYAMITIRCLQALAASEADMACEQLEKALRLAQPGGFLRTFADQGADLEPYLRRLLRRGVMPDYIQRILSIIEARAPKQVLGQLSLVEPLSPRELEVLAHLVSGLTNRQIAEQLIVSTGTVKTHVHNICAKLGAENRTSAAARARELGLV